MKLKIHNFRESEKYVMLRTNGEKKITEKHGTDFN